MVERLYVTTRLFLVATESVQVVQTRSRHENFRSRQSSVMVRRSHVAMEFICVATGNRHYASGKLVMIRHSACDRALSAQRHALGEHTIRHARTIEARAGQMYFVTTKISLSRQTFLVAKKK